MRNRTFRSHLAPALAILLGLAACGDLVEPEGIAEPEAAPLASTTGSSGPSITATALLSGSGEGISESGLVTGYAYASGRQEAFLWDGGSTQFLGVLDESVSYPYSVGQDVNDNGEVVGNSRVDRAGISFGSQAFLWYDGTMTALPDPVNDRDIRSSGARAINRHGDVAGSVGYTSGHNDAILWRSDGGAEVLPALGTAGGSWAADINDNGQIVGASLNDDGQWEATIWENGEPRGLGLVGGSRTVAMAINEAGDVVGMRDVNDIVLWPADGPAQVLVHPDVTLDLSVYDINDDRQIVAVTREGLRKLEPQEIQAWVWSAGTFTPLESPDPFYVDGNTWVKAINNAGQAIGSAETATGSRVTLWEISSTVTVAIDINPGGDPNAIACDRSETVVPVAVLSTQESAGEAVDFDATTVDHTTVAFEGAGEYHVNPGTGVPTRHEEDVDRDGDTDLVLHFQLGATDLTCSSTEGTLTGETYDGTPITGTDAVRMVGS